MLKDILPDNVMRAINLLNYDDLCEIRFRINRPTSVNYKNTYYFLGVSGLCNEKNAIIATKETISSIISKASNYSVYAVNDEIKEGFLAFKNGIRIGVVGTIIMQDGKILTTKNISSINIRIPHQVVGSSYKITKFLFDENDNLQNLLVIGAPGTGKTTILRDLCAELGKIKKEINILLLDERFEIASCYDGVPQMNVGVCTDIICGGKKDFNIINGIRSMSPNLIVTDEIGSTADLKSIEYAVNSGVSVFASVHAKNIFEFQKKQEFENLIKSRTFKRIVVLSQNKQKGNIENIYNEYLRPILEFV